MARTTPGTLAVDGRYLRAQGTGIHQYLVAALRALIESGIDVTVLSPEGSPCRDDLVPGARWLAFGSSHDSVWELRDLPRALVARRFSVYWAPGNTGVPLRRVAPTRTVATVHDLVPLRLPRMHLARDPGYALPYLARIAVTLWRADHLLTDSETSANDIRRFARRSATVVPASLGTTPTTPDPALLPGELEGRAYLVYTGGGSKRKNLERLLEAFARIPGEAGEPLLVLLGSGYVRVGRLATSLGLGDRLLLTGHVSEEVKTAVVAFARALVYPSLYEGFGLPILEAFQLGVPVVTSDRGAMREVGGDAACYVDPTSIDSIAAGIARALDAEARQRYGASIARRAARFDPGAARRELVAFFRPLLAREP